MSAASPSIRIELDAAKLASLQNLLKDVRDGVPKAIVAAANKTAVTGRQRIVTRVAAEFNLTQAHIRENLSIKKATYEHMEAVIRIGRKPIPLMDFKPRQNETGVTVTVRKSKGAEEHAHWFIATMKSGHQGVFDRERGPNKSGRVNRLKIQEKFGPTPLRFFENAPGVHDEEVKGINEIFAKNIASQVDRLLERKKSF